MNRILTQKSSQHKLAFVIGTRPEAIKLSPLVDLCRESAIVILTGQHEDWFVQIGDHFTDVDILRTRPMATHSRISQELDMPIEATRLNEIVPLVTQMADTLCEASPQHVVVQGDTRSALVGSLAARALQIPVSHVEAGLRSGSLADPNPEELYRRLITQLATYHYAPTVQNRENLVRDGVKEEQIFLVGNTVVDGLALLAAATERLTPARERPFVVITLHRNQTRQTRQQQLEAVGRAASELPQLDFLLILHPNPLVEEHISSFVAECASENVETLPPQSRTNFLSLVKHAEFVISDSGGVQEEAPFLGKRVLVMRDYTERPEALGPLGNLLVGSDGSGLIGALKDQGMSALRSFGERYPFGDGQCARRIWSTMRNHL